MKIAWWLPVRRSLVVTAVLAGCSLLYDPGKLPSTGADLSDASIGSEPVEENFPGEVVLGINPRSGRAIE